MGEATLYFLLWCYNLCLQFNFFKWLRWCYTKHIKVSFDSDELRGEVLTVLFSAVASINASKRVHSKGNQTWIFIGRTDAEADTPILWPPDAKKRLWCWERLKARGEGDNRGWHHRLDGYEFEQAPGVGDGQGSLACCSPWDRKESDTTEWLNWTGVL